VVAGVLFGLLLLAVGGVYLGITVIKFLAGLATT
jgi:hypothetical protein